MRFSVITPVHKINHQILGETAASLRRQTFTDFEWILVPNGEAQHWDLSGVTLPAQTRVVRYDGTPGVIGEIKRFAFTQGGGDWLVELDWDDVLTDDALETLANWSPGADFLYSNCAYFTGDFKPAQRFNPAMGWTWRPFEWRGHALDEIVSWPVSPASILWIYFAPDHVRCWRRESYYQIGRHNSALPVCDDHELLIRTYLSGAVMRHVDRCLYLYRNDGNTFLQRQDEIHRRTRELYRANLTPVVLKWAQDKYLTAFDLGGGFNCPKGFVSVDLKNAALDVDLSRYPWPFEESSVGVIRAYDFLEHLPDKMATLREIHRVLAPGGWLLSFTPSALGQGGFQDPTHVSYWVRNSFYYVTKQQQAQYIGNTDVRFKTHVLVEEYPNDWLKEQGILYVTFEGQALKGDLRLPGLQEI